jgi:hypothetical protein
MRLNALHPSENPMEELLFCFGGGDDDGGGGGDEPGDALSPGQETAAHEATGADFGGDRDDGGDRDERNPGNIGVGSGASLGATSNQNFSSGTGRTTDDGDNRSFALPNYAPLTESNVVREGYFSSSLPGYIQDVQDRNVVRSATDITSGLQTGTEDRDTRIDPMDPFAGEALMTPDERARSNAELLASIGRTADRGPSISSTPSIAPSPYEQLIGAPEFQTSMGAPPGSTKFGEVDIPFVPTSIDVFGLEVPTGLGVVEGVLNAIFDPTGTTQQAVYDKGVRSINGQPTGNETGLDVLTEEGSVIGAYDPDANIVYATEGNRFNPALDSYYQTKRERDEEERGESDEPILVDPTDIQEEDVAVEEDTEYQGQPIGGLFPTSTLPDVNRELTQYTPVGDIQPFVLRPYGMKKGGIVDAAKFKNGGMVQRYQNGGSVDDATKRLADLVYQSMTTGVSTAELQAAERAAGLSGTDQFGRERNELLRSAGYTPGNLQEFYGSTGGPSDPRTAALYERYTGENRPEVRSNLADLGYLQSQGFDVSRQVSAYDPAAQRQIRQAAQQATIAPLQRQYDTLQQQFDDLMARFEESERQKRLLQGMGSGQFGESSMGAGTGIDAGLGGGLQLVPAATSPYTQLDVAPGLGSQLVEGFKPTFLEPVTPETNFLSDPFSPATNVGYVPPPVYYPFAYQVPGQQQT